MRIFLILSLFLSTTVFAQGDILAKEYFKNGDFKKALFEYEKLYAQASTNINYAFAIVETQQQLEQYDDAEAFLLKLMTKFNYVGFLVELGYNYQLKKDLVNAKLYYDKALESIDLRQSNAYPVGQGFRNHGLLNEAIAAYQKSMDLGPKYNFNLQLAQLYGEQGDIEKMFANYIDYVEKNPLLVNNVKRYINDFISENGANANNVLFRKILLKKAQQEPNVLWNELLSWLFIQQKEVNKAFIQEKAIFNREPESLNRIIDLAGIAVNENQNETAKTIYEYIIEKSQDLDVQLKAHYYLLQLETKESTAANYKAIQSKYLELFEQFGVFPQTLNLQISYAHFLAFYLNETEKATSFLEDTLKLQLTELQKAEVKLELGDILVLQEKFNEALIYYTQIQRNLKNSTISQIARFKVAKTSYYKGDFKWAESQLKILKSSTSQLTANDALDLKLLISDNRAEDSLQVALTKYAKADLLAFQNKNDQAISILNSVLTDHKTEVIVPQALLKQAALFEIKNEFENAKSNYQRIITDFKDSILLDNALYNLAELLVNHLNQPEEAKKLYEQLLFNHSDSIYAVDARKKFRALRGDTLN